MVFMIFVADKIECAFRYSTSPSDSATLSVALASCCSGRVTDHLW